MKRASSLGTALIVAREEVRAPAEGVLRVLLDLDAHQDLTDGGLEIVQLYGPRGRRTGGVVVLRGPAGIRRHAVTRVQGAEAGRLWGKATTSNGTEAKLEWLLRPTGAATSVEVRLHLRPRHWRDHVLLHLGARRWLHRRLAAALTRLEPAALKALHDPPAAMLKSDSSTPIELLGSPHRPMSRPIGSHTRLLNGTSR